MRGDVRGAAASLGSHAPRNPLCLCREFVTSADAAGTLLTALLERLQALAGGGGPQAQLLQHIASLEVWDGGGAEGPRLGPAASSPGLSPQ